MTTRIHETPKPVSITCRVDACRCGCKGSDPWHRKTISRKVCGLRQSTRDLLGPLPMEAVAAFGYQAMPVMAEGMARFPWGEARVVVVASRRRREDGLPRPLGFYLA